MVLYPFLIVLLSSNNRSRIGLLRSFYDRINQNEEKSPNTTGEEGGNVAQLLFLLLETHRDYLQVCRSMSQ